MRGPKIPRRGFGYIALAMLTGCARWSSQEKPPAQQPFAAPILSADTVIVEIAFPRIPLSDDAAHNAIWAAADEQHFSTDLRRLWGMNGMRCGVFGNQLPEPLREALTQQPLSLENQSEDDTQLEFSRAPHREPCRAGRPVKVIASKQKESMAYILRNGNQVNGQPLSQATCMLRLKAFPKGDGTVRFDMQPEIEHGEIQQKWVGDAGSLRMDAARDRIVISPLRLEAVLSPGQTLALSSTPELKGLGDHFFSDSTSGTPQRTWLLIRLVQTQHDDLFAPDRIATPLTTPGD